MTSSSRADPLGGLAPQIQHEVSDANSSQVVAVYRGGVIVVRIRGVVRAGPDTNHITAKLAQAVATNPRSTRVFFDLEGFTQYDSDVRVRYTEALRPQSSRVERIYVYAVSRLVRMGASVASLVLPQLKLVDRQQFDRLLREAISSS